MGIPGASAHAPGVASTKPSAPWLRLGWIWIAFGVLSLPMALVGMFTLTNDGVDEGAWIVGLLTIGSIFTFLFVAAGLLVVFDKRWARQLGVAASCVAFPLSLILIVYGILGSPAVAAWGVAAVVVEGLSIKGIVDRAKYLRNEATQRGPEVVRRTDLRIFISYRRADSADVTDRLGEHLVSRFVDENIFRDIHSIPLGVDFRDHINASIARCDVLLAVIGSKWLEVRGPQGGRRIDDPTDFVRLEIESALSRTIPVIPILVQNASMPQTTMLPESLQPLAFRNALPVRPDPDFRNDVGRLFSALEAIKPLAPTDGAEPDQGIA